MYAETDFLLALVKEDDWLSEPAEDIYREHGDELWTSEYTLVELMMVAYRESWNVLRTVAAAKQLVDVQGETEDVLAAASHVEDHGFTPFDALHLVRSGDDAVVSSDSSYDGYSDRVELESLR